MPARRSHRRAGGTEAAGGGGKASERTDDTPTSIVLVVWAAGARAPTSDHAAATDAAHACLAALGGRTLSGTAGALLACPRVDLHVCGRASDRGGGGRRGRGWRTEGDVALHGAAELDQVRVSCFRGER